MLHEMQTEQKELRMVVAQMMWYMRGSLSRQEAWTLSPEERKDVVRVVDERREITQKPGLPLM